MPTQKQGFFSPLLRCPAPLVQAPPLFTCATDHTQTRSRMSLSFLKYARICICGHEHVKGSQSVPCAGDYPDYISTPVFAYIPFFCFGLLTSVYKIGSADFKNMRKVPEYPANSEEMKALAGINRSLCDARWGGGVENDVTSPPTGRTAGCSHAKAAD